MKPPKFLFVFLLFAASFASLEAVQLHSIIVADTTDDTIGNSTACDFCQIREEMKKVVKYTGLEHHEVLITGTDVVSENVFHAINALEIDEDDVVVFYFSGHGYRTKDKENNPWPNLYFTLSGKGIDLLHLSCPLKEKGPRLLIVIGDVCNNFISENFAPRLARKLFSDFNDEELIKANYQSLFLENQGTLMISSSVAGEYSWATTTGSLFTLSFLGNLDKVVKSEDYPEWEAILLKTLFEIAGDQHPQWEFQKE